MSEESSGERGRKVRRTARKTRSRARPRDELRGRLRPHDPFELIRWLALSQPDPRKALAELVQNSLDAGARTVRVIRRRERGAPCLFVYDDGDGVIPEMDRPEALQYIATHIGHSRKRSLSPQERLALMTQGQYGIGLLGFWSLGEKLEMRSAVPGQRPHRLILHRDKPSYRIEPLRGHLALDARWTEVVVVGLHRQAQSALIGRRAADYLASELRGQLLGRSVDLVVEDRMSRGRAQKVIPVRPPRFLGERLEGIGPIELPGYPPIRFELYLSGAREEDDGSAPLAVYSAGTLVAESFHELAALGLDHEPWTDTRLSGIVDFPAFRVAPGSRRGVFVDEAATAFALALRSVEPVLVGVLEALERRRAEEIDRSLVRDLQRVFRDFHRHRPRYALLPVRRDPPGDEARTGGDGDGAPGMPAAEGKPAEADGDLAERRRPTVPLDLLPPGPLASVRVTPAPVRVERGGRRSVRAVACDALGRRIEHEVAFDFRLEGSAARLELDAGDPTRATVIGGEEAGSCELVVVAESHGVRVATRVEVAVVEEIAGGRGNEGIPEPELVHHPGAPWRSRMLEARWQVNSGHRDFRAVADRPVIKLRYLAMLFAKEVVLQSHHDPRLAEPLEQLVEVAAYADRQLANRGRRKRKPSGE